MAQAIILAILFMEVFNMTLKEHIISILKIIVFIGLFLFVYTFLTYVMKHPGVNLNNIAGFYGEKKNSLDMVYIGGSAAFVYWEPLKAYEEKGIASYTFGADTMQAEGYTFLIKEILKRQNPEVILIDARAFQYRDYDQPPTEVAYRNIITGAPFSLNRAQFIEKNVPKYLNMETLPFHFDLIKYHDRRSEFDTPNSIKMMFQTYQNPLKGFYFVPEFRAMEKLDFMTDIKTPVSEVTTEVLTELLDFLKTTNQKYLFLVSPYQEREEHKENFNYVEEKIEEAGYDFIDMNEYRDTMGLDYDKDFYDKNHVNIFGADKYTEFLSNYLLEKYTLPDRREDKNYHQWNTLLENWHTQVEETKMTIIKSMEEEI